MAHNYQKYGYSVLDVIAGLNTHHRGTGDGYSEEEYKELAGWLHWRVTEMWDNELGRTCHIDSDSQPGVYGLEL